MVRAAFSSESSAAEGRRCEAREREGMDGHRKHRKNT